MIVRLDTSLLWLGSYYGHGDEIDLPPEVAERYIATRQAERIESAAIVAPETAALQKPTFKGNKHGRTTAAR